MNESHKPFRHQKIKSLFLDVDSTTVGRSPRFLRKRAEIEGIDILAELRGVKKEVVKITKQAMNGFTPFNLALIERLKLINPKKSDIEKVSQIYLDNIVSDAVEVCKVLRKAGVDISFLSGGFVNTMKDLAKRLNIPISHIYANKLLFNRKGEFIGFDDNLLSQNKGKGKQIFKLLNERTVFTPIAVMGDGATDVTAIKDAKAKNGITIGFGGFVTRKKVKEYADIFLTEPTFAPLILLLLDPSSIRELFYTQPKNREILMKSFNSLRGIIFSDRAKPIQESIISLYEEFVFFTNNPHKIILTGQIRPRSKGGNG